MKLGLREITLIAVVASALTLLDGELFFLSQVRGEQFLRFSGLTQISILIAPRLLSSYVGVLGNLLAVKIYNFFNEQGVFSLYFISLAVGSICYLRVLERISKDTVFSFVLAIWGIIGIVSSIHDLSTSLAFLLCSAEMILLMDVRLRDRPLFLPLWFFHMGVDSSFLLPLCFRRLSIGAISGSLYGLLFSSMFVCQGELASVYTYSATFIVLFLGFMIALQNRAPRLIVYSIFLPFAFFIWQRALEQRFPALAFFAPLVVANVWAVSSLQAQSKLAKSLAKLQSTFSNFLTAKNKIALYWFCLAFIFFQTATKFRHPLNEAYLPKEAMDAFVENRPASPPLHPIKVGGYVGFRLAPIFTSGSPLNYIDMSTKHIDQYLQYRDYERIWNGENPELFQKLNANEVLCQGKDKLCDQLKADDHWKILSQSTLGEKIMQKLRNLPVKQKEIVSRKLEQESWYLLAKK